MGKSSKVKRKFTVSSGEAASRRRRREVRRLKMKVARWKRNKAAGKPVSENTAKRYPNRYNWDTSGLERQIKFLEGLL